MSLYELFERTASATRAAHNQVQGVSVAIVQDIRDPKGIGRVKVLFPWLAAGSDEAVNIEANEAGAHSAWARLALPSAGSKRGAYFIPDVGDEVLVAFEHGELDRPIIVGTLWNAQDAPPYSMDKEGKNNQRAIQTRSGHRILFDDSDDQPFILVEDQSGENRIRIDSRTNSMEISVQADLTIRAGGAIHISAGKAITVETDADLQVKAQGAGSLTTTGSLALKSNAQAVLEAQGQAEVKAATVRVNGSGMAEIKGGIVKIN